MWRGWGVGGSKLPFQRLVREIAETKCKGLRWENKALLALQTGVEDLMGVVFKTSNWGALHAGRQTLMPRDMRLSLRTAKAWGAMSAQFFEDKHAQGP